MDEMRPGEMDFHEQAERLEQRQPREFHVTQVATGGSPRPSRFASIGRPVGGITPPGFPVQQTADGLNSVGYNAHTRHNITQIFFGCQNVMIYAAEGHVELLLSMDPSGRWQPLTPDAAEELSTRLYQAARAARDRAQVHNAEKENSNV